MSATKSQNQLTKHDILAYLTSIKPELEKVGITKLGLFGSYAKDINHCFSDIDIVIENDMNIAPKGFAYLILCNKLRKKIALQLKKQIDLCDTTSMPQEQKKRLLKGAIYV